MARYSLVVHLESAAIDTTLYNALCTNNAARHETDEEARAQDLATQQAWASHPNVKMIRNCVCGEDFEKKKQLAVACVLEHLGLAASSTTTHRRLFLLRRHPPTSLFDRESLKCDFFTIDSTFLRDVAGQGSDRVVERRGRVGGVWTYTLSHAIALNTTAAASVTDKTPPPSPAKSTGAAATKTQKYIDEVRIGGRIYTGLLAERDTARTPVRRKERVFTHFVAQSGRDVVHRLVEILGSSAQSVGHRRSASETFNGGGGATTDEPPHGVSKTRGPLPSSPSFVMFPTGTSPGSSLHGGAEAAAAAAAAAAEVNNIELLYVDGLDDGSEYEPPAFLVPFIDHEVVDADEREKYSLMSLSERRNGGLHTPTAERMPTS